MAEDHILQFEPNYVIEADTSGAQNDIQVPLSPSSDTDSGTDGGEDANDTRKAKKTGRNGKRARRDIGGKTKKKLQADKRL